MKNSPDSSMSSPALRHTALIAATLASFLTPFMSSSINIALPAIGTELSLSAVQLGWIATAYLLAASVALIPFGKLADILGRKKIFTIGLAVYSGAALLCALAPSGTLLVAFRVLQGTGAGLIYSTSVAILTSVYPAGKRGLALGITSASTYLGLSVGPVLGGLITGVWGWRSVFWLNVPVGAAALLLVLFRLKGEWAGARGESFDLVGSLLLGLTLPVMIYGMSRLPAAIGIILTAAGAIGLGCFLAWEGRSGTPVFPVSLLRCNRTFTFSSLAALINYSSTFAVTFLLSLYLQYVKGLPPQQTGLILVAQPVMMAAFSPLAGRLSDRIEVRILASIGMAGVAAVLAAFSFLGEDTGYLSIIAALLALGLGYAFFSSPNMNAIMSSVDRHLYGVASATLGTMRLLGQMFSMSIAVVIFSLLIGQMQITPELHGAFLKSVRIAFAVFACLCTAGVFASLVRGRLHSA